MTRRPDFRPIMRRFMAGESVWEIEVYETSGADPRPWRKRTVALERRVVEDAIRRAMLASEKRRRRKR